MRLVLVHWLIDLAATPNASEQPLRAITAAEEAQGNTNRDKLT